MEFAGAQPAEISKVRRQARVLRSTGDVADPDGLKRFARQPSREQSASRRRTRTEGADRIELADGFDDTDCRRGVRQWSKQPPAEVLLLLKHSKCQGV